MQPAPVRRSILVAALLALAVSFGATAARADEAGDPDVARVSVLRGAVDVKRADSGDTLAATVNAPLSAGDYVTTGEDAHAEIQFPFGASLRVASGTQLRFTRLEAEAHVAQLAAGTVELRVFRGLQAHPEIATPASTVRPLENGRYRISVNQSGDSAITVRSGRAEVITQTGTRTLEPGSTLAVTGSADATQLQTTDEVASDAFDRWNGERDSAVERTRDFGYVDRGIVGADDLDRYGRWEDSAYGRAWRPDVASGWAPYSDGRWIWQPYYGWTWVAAEPWGWAPYHYGRWFYAADGWCWSPGIVARWPVVYSSPLFFGSPVAYQPALVAFFSFGSGFGGFGFGSIGWVPLAPFEQFSPWWGPHFGGRRGGADITNVTNVTNVTKITNVNNYSPNPGRSLVKMYRNANVPGGTVAVKADNFAGGRFERVAHLEASELSGLQPIRGVLPVVPTVKNLAFSTTPPATHNRLLETRFSGFTAPSVTPRPFKEQQAAVRASTLQAYPHATTILAPPSAVRAPHPNVAAPARHIEHVERIEGATLVAPAGASSPAHATSPWDRFGVPDQRAPIRSIGEPASTHHQLRQPADRTATLVAPADPFSRFDAAANVGHAPIEPAPRRFAHGTQSGSNGSHATPLRPHIEPAAGRHDAGFYDAAPAVRRDVPPRGAGPARGVRTVHGEPAVPNAPAGTAAGSATGSVPLSAVRPAAPAGLPAGHSSGTGAMR